MVVTAVVIEVVIVELQLKYTAYVQLCTLYKYKYKYIYLQVGCAAADLNITQPGQEARGGDIRQWFAPLLVTDVLEGRLTGECS